MPFIEIKHQRPPFLTCWLFCWCARGCHYYYNRRLYNIQLPCEVFICEVILESSYMVQPWNPGELCEVNAHSIFFREEQLLVWLCFWKLKHPTAKQEERVSMKFLWANHINKNNWYGLNIVMYIDSFLLHNLMVHEQGLANSNDVDFNLAMSWCSKILHNWMKI